MDHKRRPKNASANYVFSKALSVDTACLSDRRLEDDDEESQNKRSLFGRSSRVSIDESTGLPKQGNFFKSLQTAIDYNLDHPQVQGVPVKPPANKDYQQQFEDFKARRALNLHGVKIPQTEKRKVEAPPTVVNEKTEEKKFRAPLTRSYSTGNYLPAPAVLARQKAARKGPPPPVPTTKKRASSGIAGSLPTVPDIGEEVTESEIPVKPSLDTITNISNDETKVIQASVEKPAHVNVQNESTNVQGNSPSPDKENTAAGDEIRHHTTHDTASDKTDVTTLENVPDTNELKAVLESFPKVSEEGENKDETIEKIQEENESQAVLKEEKPIEKIECEGDQPVEKESRETQASDAVIQDPIVCEDKSSESQVTLESFPDIGDTLRTEEGNVGEKENAREEIKSDSETTFQTENQTISQISPDVTVTKEVNKHDETPVKQSNEAPRDDLQINSGEQTEETTVIESESTLETPADSAEIKPEEIGEHPIESETNLKSCEEVDLQSNQETELDEIKNASQPEEDTITIGVEPTLENIPDVVITEAKPEKDGGDLPERDTTTEEIKPETEPQIVQLQNEAQTEAGADNVETQLEHTSTIQEIATSDDNSNTVAQLDVDQEIITGETKLQEENEPEIDDKTTQGIVLADGTHLQSVVKELSETITSLENTLNGGVHTPSESESNLSETTNDSCDQTKNVEEQLETQNNCQDKLENKIDGNGNVIDCGLQIKNEEKLQFESQVEQFSENIPKTIVTDEETINVQLHNESEAKIVENSQEPDETLVNLQTGGEKQIEKTHLIDDDNVFESTGQVLENSSQACNGATENSQIRCENSDEIPAESPKTNEVQRKLSQMAERLLSFSEDNNVVVVDDDDAELSCVEKDLVMINKCFDDMSNDSAISIAEREEMEKQKQIENLRKEMEEMK